MKTGDSLDVVLPKWIVYVPDDGWEAFDTEQEARDCFDQMVDVLRDEASEGWVEDASGLAIYELRPVARLSITVTASADDDTEVGEQCRERGWDYMAEGTVVECRSEEA